jgi:hypothetical protein
VVTARRAAQRARPIPDEKRRVAEIEIDSVTYHLRHGPARLYEVEIETEEPTFDLRESGSQSGHD